MLSFISANLGNIIVIAILAVIVGAIIWSMIKAKRSGKGGCCGNCAECGGCHHSASASRK